MRVAKSVDAAETMGFVGRGPEPFGIHVKLGTAARNSLSRVAWLKQTNDSENGRVS